MLASSADVGTPAQLTPIFFGCFDWHSAVHGHWTLARIARLFPTLPVSKSAYDVLERHFKHDKVAGEVAYLSHPDRSGFERPYGLAWLLQLCTELREWQSADANRWANLLEPLETLVVTRLVQWLPKLTAPIRSGEHSQTAFAFGLIWDWAVIANRNDVRSLLTECGLRFYFEDRNAPVAYEPSGHDFLSPSLAEADFVRRILPRTEFANWLTEFLPSFDQPASKPFVIQTVGDASDGKLSHLDGLNLSRAWMLHGIAHALPESDVRRPRLIESAQEHADFGSRSLTGEHYAGGHWLGSFAVYLFSNRGLPPSQDS